jgi:hypothetical protein
MRNTSEKQSQQVTPAQYAAAKDIFFLMENSSRDELMRRVSLEDITQKTLETMPTIAVLDAIIKGRNQSKPAASGVSLRRRSRSQPLPSECDGKEAVDNASLSGSEASETSPSPTP